MMHTRLCPVLLVLALGAAAIPAYAQTPPPKSLYDRYTEPIAIYQTGLGSFTRPISSTNKEAQAYFDQGFQMMYSFAKPEAVRSFREAWKRDPQCAICYWGEAWAWGSYLNGAMNEEEAPHVYRDLRSVLAAHADTLAVEHWLRPLIVCMAPSETFDPYKD